MNEQERETLCAILRTCARVEKATLFGSRTNGTAEHYSDVDIALHGKNLTLDDVFHIHSRIEDTPLPYSFDLIRYDFIQNEKLIQNIDSCGVGLM